MGIVRESDSAVASNSSTTLVITKPTGVVSGDVLVVNTFHVGNHSITWPSGWVEIEQTFVGRLPGTAYLVAGGSEPANYTITWSGSGANAGAISRYSGVDNTTIEDVANSLNWATSTSPLGSGITTVTDGAMIAWACITSDVRTITQPSGFSEAYEANNIELADEIQVTAGASGDKTGTLSGSSFWAVTLFALRPAAAATGIEILRRRRM